MEGTGVNDQFIEELYRNYYEELHRYCAMQFHFAPAYMPNVDDIVQEVFIKAYRNRKELLTHDSDQAVLTLLKTDELIESDFNTVKIDATLGELVDVVADSRRNIFPVIDSRNHFQGYVSLEDIRREMFKTEQYQTLHVYNFMKSATPNVYFD